MSYDTILFSVDGGIARLTLNRPDKLNSFNTQMHGEVRDALERAHGVYTDAAKLLDIHPNYLHRLVRALGLR